MLRAVAALQPLRTRDGDFRDALEELTGRAFDQLVPHLSAWEDAGILLRRGQTYRVVPDLLGDALLARAAMRPGHRRARPNTSTGSAGRPEAGRWPT